MKRLQPLVVAVADRESEVQALDDTELAARTILFKERLDNGAKLDELLPDAFATVREASRRVLNMRHYDVQIIGGIVLHEGKIAEMKTGEGKTLVATSAMYLNALAGKGAHLVTVNDYLAERDADWMGQVYKFLGLSVGKILTDMSNEDRRRAYASDITYGTNNEFGFDYLRDNMKFRLEDYVQRGHFYAIVDEVDSILIDEARTPLIISGSIEQDVALYYEINKMVPFLKKDEDYMVDEKHHSVTLTDEGIERLEKHLGVDNIYDPRHIEYLHHVNKALQAHTLYKRDQNYVVDDGKVVIVDEFTGRLMPGRRWSDGLHQAVEAKEGVPVQDESRTLATITFQNYFRMYSKLSGMTGTADTEAEEFKKIYNLDVVVIPTNKTCVRLDQPDVIYRSERDKIGAIIDQIIECHRKGQPLLVGTVSVEKSEVISKVLTRKGISHSVLNAKNHGREAEIIAQAGRKGAVTIATNMAGRGTDILLGGNPEFLHRKAGGDDEGKLDQYREMCAKEKAEVIQAGGLFVLGTERHEARRIDNQLRGRAGRQGDPGESRFFLSLDDDLMRIFGAERIGGLMDKLGMEAGVPIEHKLVSNAIANAQKRVEGRNFDIRKHLLEYDDVMNAQRKAVYELRAKVLKGEGIRDLVMELLEDALIAVAGRFAPEGVMSEDWDIAGLQEGFRQLTGIELEIPRELVATSRRQEMLTHLWEHIESTYEKKEEEFQYLADRYNERFGDIPGFKPKSGSDVLHEIEQQFYLREIDQQWREHLSAMSSLRDAISLRGYAQKDPKQEYKREGYDIFVEMLALVKSNVGKQIFRVKVQREDELDRVAAARPVAAPRAQESRPEQEAPRAKGEPEAPPPAEKIKQKQETVVRDEPKVGRNDPCWCGSGKKYKLCHLKLDQRKKA
jgi:preprotein translocase subunit SecA